LGIERSLSVQVEERDWRLETRQEAVEDGVGDGAGRMGLGD
jgi:hypothetical protein